MAADVCSIAECGSKRIARGYCTMHYKRFMKNGDPLLARRIRGIVRDSEGRKKCVRCKEWLPLSIYGQNGRNVDGLGSYCRPCNISYQRMRKFRLTEVTYQEMLAQQGGCCAICKSPDPGPRSWHVDHDHACCPTPHRTAATTCGACVRGLLCHLCNTSLGGFRDSPELLLAAAAYLESTKLQVSAQGAA